MWIWIGPKDAEVLEWSRSSLVTQTCDGGMAQHGWPKWRDLAELCIHVLVNVPTHFFFSCCLCTLSVLLVPQLGTRAKSLLENLPIIHIVCLVSCQALKSSADKSVFVGSPDFFIRGSEEHRGAGDLRRGEGELFEVFLYVLWTLRPNPNDSKLGQPC